MRPHCSCSRRTSPRRGRRRRCATSMGRSATARRGRSASRRRLTGSFVAKLHAPAKARMKLELYAGSTLVARGATNVRFQICGQRALTLKVQRRLRPRRVHRRRLEALAGSLDSGGGTCPLGRCRAPPSRERRDGRDLADARPRGRHQGSRREPRARCAGHVADAATLTRRLRGDLLRPRRFRASLAGRRGARGAAGRLRDPPGRPSRAHLRRRAERPRLPRLRNAASDGDRLAAPVSRNPHRVAVGGGP